MAKASTELAERNAAGRDAFVAALGGAFGNLGRAGLSGAELQRLEHLDGDNRHRFGMPFNICVGRHTRRHCRAPGALPCAAVGLAVGLLTYRGS